MSGFRQDRPFLRLAISAADPANDQRLQSALVEIAGQDHPRVRVNTQPEDGLYCLDGRAELDLNLICDRLRDDYHIAINVAPPQAILIETIRKPSEAEGRYIRQIGGSGNYGHCKLRIEPAGPGGGCEFINDIKGGAVPNEYIKSINEGVQEAMNSGILAGFPLVDVRVRVSDGSYHEGDSNEMAFKIAGAIAFREAAKKANPVILEPMMSFEIELPEGLILAIRSEILAHRGRIERDEVTANGLGEIKAIVPLSELLASASGELAEFPMEFAGYEPVRDHNSPHDGAAGVIASKPNHPRLGSRSGMARIEPEED
jgi:elongation factor G